MIPYDAVLDFDTVSEIMRQGRYLIVGCADRAPLYMVLFGLSLVIPGKAVHVVEISVSISKFRDVICQNGVEIISIAVIHT